MKDRMLLIIICFVFISILSAATDAFLIEESHESLDLYVGNDDS